MCTYVHTHNVCIYIHTYIHTRTLYQHAWWIKQMSSQHKSKAGWKYCNYPPSKTQSYPPLRALKQKHSKIWLWEHKVTTTNCLLHLLALQSYFDRISLKSRPSPVFACSQHPDMAPAISGLNRLISVTQYIHSTLGF